MLIIISEIDWMNKPEKVNPCTHEKKDDSKGIRGRAEEISLNL